MAELIEEQDAERSDVERFFEIVRRRHLHFLIPFFLTWLIVWGLTWVLPRFYKSSTQILVEQPTMPSNYVSPNVNDNVQARLQSITQQILSRTRLILIMNKLNLYGGGAQNAADDDSRVASMRKDISIDLVRDARNSEITAFKVSYSARDPRIAQQVTTELTNLFINENSRVREQESEDTTKFIEDQLEAARVQLSAQEAKVKAFEGQHEGVLPSQQTSNLQILGGLQSQLQNEQDSLSQSKQQKIYLQALIDQNRAASGAVRADGTPTGLAEVNQQLEKLRTQLVDLSSRYTDQYPDVVKLKEQIAKTERLRDELRAAPKKPADETSVTSRDIDGLGPNSTLAQLQGQFKANQAEITNREHRVEELQQRINEYQGRLNAAPSTEQQLDEVTRGYDQSKAIYDELLKKKNSSVMATSMEQLQQGEHFTVLDPPSLPNKPDFPNKLKFCGIGLALGLLIGVVAAGGFEFADDRLHSDSDLRDMLPMAILSEVPEVLQPGDEARGKRRLALSWAVSAVVVVAIVAGAAISILQS
jgi:polysaccharide chain length determinant protein (PEP-CTERM system associated)